MAIARPAPILAESEPDCRIILPQVSGVALLGMTKRSQGRRFIGRTEWLADSILAPLSEQVIKPSNATVGSFYDSVSSVIGLFLKPN